jgi:hypothetical protein
VRLRHPLRRASPARAAVIVTAALAFGLSPGATALAQMGPAGVGVAAEFGQRFGLGMFGGEISVVTPQTAWGLVSSGYTLAAVDPLSGALVPGDVTTVISPDRAIVHEMLAAGQLAFDTQQAADQVRQIAEARRQEAGQLALERDDSGPEDFDIERFSSCGTSGNANFSARTDVVVAWEQMCRAAERDGVVLQIVSALRTPSEQHELYRRAIAKYGSVEAARRWVAPSDGKDCLSNHCRGVAIDVAVSSNPAARAWLHAPVGCHIGGRVEMGRTDCAGGQTIKNSQRYGFILPLSHEPWHLELGIRLG